MLVMLGLAAALLAAPGLAQFNAVLTLALSVLAVTAVSGITMQRMLTSNCIGAKASYDEWAYKPAPLESRSEHSIWDDAI